MNIHIPSTFDSDSLYVADMTEHHQLDTTMEGLVDFGTPVVASNSTLLAATAIVSGATLTVGNSGILNGGLKVNDAFGRILNITSTDAGAATIYGRDYLNQQMSEDVTCTAGTVATAKAFKYVDRIVSVAVDGDISIGPGTKLGMPFVVSEIFEEYANGVPASAPTLTAAVATTPSATTGDIRGTVTPATTLNGATVIQMKVRFNNLALGGLYGQRQA